MVNRTIAAVVASFMIAGAAHAEYHLVNLTDAKVAVAVACGGVTQRIELRSHDNATVPCADAAHIRLTTEKLGGAATVSTSLTGSGAYWIDLDQDGNINVRRPGQAFASRANDNQTVASR